MNENYTPKVLKLIELIKSRNIIGKEKIILEVIKENNKNKKIVFELGIMCAENKLLSEALAIFEELHVIEPSNINYIYNLGLIYAELTEHNLAINFYTKIIEKNPTDYETLVNRSSSYIEINEYEKAAEDLEFALILNSECPEALANKGITLNQKQKYEEAIIYFEKAIELKPNYYEAYSNKSISMLNLGKHDSAVKLCDTAIVLNNNYAEAYYNKAYALTLLKKYEEANNCLDIALKLKPTLVDALINKGFVLLKLKKYLDALVILEKVSNQITDNAELFINKAVCFNHLKLFKESLNEYDKALILRPNKPEYLANKANILFEIKQYEEAIKNYELALKINPEVDWLYANYIHAKMQICNWSNFNEDIQKLLNYIDKDIKVCQPFISLTLFDLPEIQKKIAKLYVNSEYPESADLPNLVIKNKNKKIKIGYFSSDFKDHAVSILMARVFELHNREKFEIHAFSYGIDDYSKLSKRLKNGFDFYHDVTALSEIEIAKLSRKNQIDIAVDLGGFTLDNRFGVFSFRAAPIQVGYLGYLGTTGSKFIDYLIADEIIIPKHLQENYSEKIAYIPYYQANDDSKVFTKNNITKTNKEKKYFVFCNFNNNYKITPTMFDSWMRILNKCKNSKLYLFAESETARVNLLKEAELRNIQGSRIIFGERLTYDAYLDRYLECDLFLDTFPYNAGTTASDALSVGVPVLTLQGSSFSSRMASSILHSIGVPELIAKTIAEYEEMAIRLASDTRLIQNLKGKISNNRNTKPLFNTNIFINNLENCFLSLIKNKKSS